MQKSKILIINIGNLAEEVAKNIVLANIKSLVICDHAKVTKEDTMRQFLIPEGTEGQSVPKLSLPLAFYRYSTLDCTI